MRDENLRTATIVGALRSIVAGLLAVSLPACASSLTPAQARTYDAYDACRAAGYSTARSCVCFRMAAPSSGAGKCSSAPSSPHQRLRSKRPGSGSLTGQTGGGVSRRGYCIYCARRSG